MIQQKMHYDTTTKLLFIYIHKAAKKMNLIKKKRYNKQKSY